MEFPCAPALRAEFYMHYLDEFSHTCSEVGPVVFMSQMRPWNPEPPTGKRQSSDLSPIAA